MEVSWLRTKGLDPDLNIVCVRETVATQKAKSELMPDVFMYNMILCPFKYNPLQV